MGSYLNIYGILEEDDNKIPKLIVSIKNTNEIYKYFVENLNYCSSNVFNELCISDITAMLNNIDENLCQATKRLLEYERYAHQNSDLIQDIIEQKEYIEEIKKIKHQIKFLFYIIRDCNDGYSSFEKIMYNYN